MGSTMCPGRHVAINEIKIFVALIVQNLNIEILKTSKTPTFAYSRVGLGIYPPDEDHVQFKSDLKEVL